MDCKKLEGFSSLRSIKEQRKTTGGHNRHNRKKKMKIRNLLTTLGVATLAAITFNVNASNALLTPRAAGNEIKIVSGVANDPNLVAVNQGLAIAPRAAGNQIATVAGTSNDANPVVACINNMSGSPKAIQACADHPGTMPACNSVTVAPLK